MIVEMRVYYCVPGRLNALHDRFRDITLGFFDKHGIEQIGFWTTLVGQSNHTLTYLLKWESMADREKKWNAFQADPEWVKKRDATEEVKSIVQRVENQFLKPTDYSAMQ